MFKLFPRKIPQGSIMVEALTAMLILSFVVISSTPALLTAALSRSKTVRVMLATQLAQQEIDRVREILSTGNSLISCNYGTTGATPTFYTLCPYTAATVPSGYTITPSNYTNSDLPGVPTTAPTFTSPISTVSAPTAICTANTYGYCANATDGEIVTLNDQQFLVQTFRSTGVAWNIADTTTSSTVPVAFRMGVRVYSAPAIINLRANSTALSSYQTTYQTANPNLSPTAAVSLSNSQRGESLAPLVVVYVDFVVGDMNSSQAAYNLFLSKTGTSCNGGPCY